MRRHNLAVTFIVAMLLLALVAVCLPGQAYAWEADGTGLKDVRFEAIFIGEGTENPLLNSVIDKEAKAITVYLNQWVEDEINPFPIYIDASTYAGANCYYNDEEQALNTYGGYAILQVNLTGDTLRVEYDDATDDEIYQIIYRQPFWYDETVVSELQINGSSIDWWPRRELLPINQEARLTLDFTDAPEAELYLLALCDINDMPNLYVYQYITPTSCTDFYISPSAFLGPYVVRLYYGDEMSDEYRYVEDWIADGNMEYLDIAGVYYGQDIMRSITINGSVSTFDDSAVPDGMVLIEDSNGDLAHMIPYPAPVAARVTSGRVIAYFDDTVYLPDGEYTARLEEVPLGYYVVDGNCQPFTASYGMSPYLEFQLAPYLNISGLATQGATEEGAEPLVGATVYIKDEYGKLVDTCHTDATGAYATNKQFTAGQNLEVSVSHPQFSAAQTYSVEAGGTLKTRWVPQTTGTDSYFTNPDLHFKESVATLGGKLHGTLRWTATANQTKGGEIIITLPEHILPAYTEIYVNNKLQYDGTYVDSQNTLHIPLLALSGNESKVVVSFTLDVEYADPDDVLRFNAYFSNSATPYFMGSASIAVEGTSIHLPHSVEVGEWFQVWGRCPLNSTPRFSVFSLSAGVSLRTDFYQIKDIQQDNNGNYTAQMRFAVPENYNTNIAGDYDITVWPSKESNGSRWGATERTRVIEAPIVLEDASVSYNGYNYWKHDKATGQRDVIIFSASLAPPFQLNLNVGAELSKGGQPLEEGKYDFSFDAYTYSCVSNGQYGTGWVNGRLDMLGVTSSFGVYLSVYNRDTDKLEAKFLIALITPIIDPSGIVTDAKTGQPVVGAKVTCYVKTDSGWEVWDAEPHNQINPMYTAEDGSYGWYVPPGTYRVVVEHADYLDYDTQDNPAYCDLIIIPPAREDIDIALKKPGQEYTLRLVANSGGSVDMTKAGNYEAGTEVNISATANTGYTFNGWTSSPSGNLFANAAQANTVFTMPQGDVTLYADFKRNSGNGGNGGGTVITPPKVPVSPQPGGIDAFTDISNHWAKESIRYAVEQGLFQGTSTTRFSPNASMTRGMFVTVLGRYAAVDVSGFTKSSFSDVAGSAYYAPYVEWAYSQGIVKGIGDNKFAPNAPITREQMAVMLVNFADVMSYSLAEMSRPKTFADAAAISPWAKDAVSAIQLAGVINGKPGNRFDPQGLATRAEVATVLYQLAYAAGHIDRRE